MQNSINSFDIKIRDISSALEDIKNYIKKCKGAEFSMDLSSLNIIDAAKILMISSAYYYGRFPEGKIKYRCMSDEIKYLIGGFAVNNLELV